MESRMMSKPDVDENLTALFEQAHRDPELKRELLRNPRAVAEKYKVKLGEEDVLQLQKLGSLSELATELRYGRLYPPRPNPVGYPMRFWQAQELLDIFTGLIAGAGTSFLYKPSWVAYYLEGGPGGIGGRTGGGISPGGVGPGPIFYPAGLINLVRERLMQALQIRTQAAR